MLTDRDGAVVQHYGYTAFGKGRYTQESSAFKVTKRYSGQKLDEDTGLYFCGSRYYDPELARFIQPDTIVPSSTTSQALNRYACVANNPLKFTDPSGHAIPSACQRSGAMKPGPASMAGPVDSPKLHPPPASSPQL